MVDEQADRAELLSRVNAVAKALLIENAKGAWNADGSVPDMVTGMIEWLGALLPKTPAEDTQAQAVMVASFNAQDDLNACRNILEREGGQLAVDAFTRVVKRAEGRRLEGW